MSAFPLKPYGFHPFHYIRERRSHQGAFAIVSILYLLTNKTR